MSICVCLFKVCVWYLCVWSIIVAIFYWLFLKDCAAKRRKCMCLSKSGRCEVWGLRPARHTDGRVGLTHAEAQKWACHSERDVLPPDINAHLLCGETSASHLIYNMETASRVFSFSNSVSLLRTWVGFNISKKPLGCVCAFSITLEKELLFHIEFNTKFMFNLFFFFFFRLKIFLIHWNSDSFPLLTNSPHSPVLRPPPRQ